MAITVELIEIVVAIVPALVSFTIAWSTPRRINGWFVKVLGTALLAVLAIGLLLIRLTGTCSQHQPVCDASAIMLPRAPGIFGSCSWCSSANGGLAQTINFYELDVQAVSAALCVVISSVTILKFMRWARRTLAPRGE